MLGNYKDVITGAIANNLQYIPTFSFSFMNN